MVRGAPASPDSSDSDDGAYTPSAEAEKSKGDYKIKHALKPPRSTTYTAQSLYEQILEGIIDLSPDYQRDVVWKEEKQVNLIDSIFRNFYIPPLIFAVSIAEDGTERRTCIDGKQRLTSIQKFMDSLIHHRDPDSPRDRYWYKRRPPHTTGFILPEKYQRLFANKQIVCIEYHGLTDTEAREIFRRVQLGVALTNAEKLKAEVRNDKTNLVHELTDKYTSRLAAIDFETKRDVVFRWIATAIYTIRRGIQTRSPASFEQVRKWLTDDNGKNAQLSEVFAENIRQSVEELMDIFEMPGALVVSQGPKTVAPLDFVMSLVLVYTTRDRFTDEDLAIAVKQMRMAARKRVKNVMWNKTAMAPYCDFIESFDAQGQEVLKTEDNDEDEDMDIDDEELGETSAPSAKRRAPSLHEPSSPPPVKKNRLAAIAAAKASKSAMKAKT